MDTTTITTMDTTTTYMCRKCRVDKDLTDFYKDKNSKTGHAYYCKDCERVRFKDRYKNNDNFRAKEKEKAKRYNKSKKIFYISDLTGATD